MILLIADSVCGGFGQPEKKSFVHLALESLEIELWDQSASGMSTMQYLDFLRTENKISKEQCGVYKGTERLECVIIALGNVDSKGGYKKNNILSSLVPNRYRSEKIDPRPYYSSKPLKKSLQYVENCLRTFCRNFLYITGNLSPKVERLVMENNFLTLLNVHADTKVIVISPSCISEKLFPGTSLRFEKLNTFLEGLASRKNVSYFDMRPNLEKQELMKDEFHLNQQGHKLLKAEFEVYLKAVLSL